EGELRLSPTVLLHWGSQAQEVQDWVARGSVREDDGLRPRNHFYDPLRDRGLTTICGGRGFAAPDWALDQPTEPEDLRFSWREARETFLRGLTNTREMDREAMLARMFRSLGDVIHLVQDMGSPQHTRNDPHVGIRFPEGVCGAESLFERHIDSIRGALKYTGSPTPLLSQFRAAW